MSAPRLDSEVVWHDVECGAYAADLPAWAELAAGAAGPVLELGAGTGRVSLHLARAGFDVVAVDSASDLIGELAHRAEAAGLAVEAVCADARRLELGREVAAVIAPMQLMHLLGGAGGRAAALTAARAHLPRAVCSPPRCSPTRPPPTARAARCFRTCASSTAGSARACRWRSRWPVAGSRFAACASS